MSVIVPLLAIGAATVLFIFRPQVRHSSATQEVDSCGRGIIQLYTAEGYSAEAIVRSHGGSAADVRSSMQPPFTEHELAVGMDRHFRVDVPYGEEHEYVRRYRKDPRVAWAGIGGCSVPLGEA